MVTSATPESTVVYAAILKVCTWTTKSLAFGNVEAT